MIRVVLLAAVCGFASAQTATPPEKHVDGAERAPDPKTAASPAPAGDSQNRRIELNLLGRANTAAGESRRNENIHFNLIDNNALKELNVRLGTTATITEFRPERGYFGVEYGNAPTPVLHLSPLSRALKGWHGNVFGSHQNSIFSARSFFQVGAVKPAHDNEYGFNTGISLWRGAHLTLGGSQQKIRGSVNGNVLVPMPGERTSTSPDPEVRALINRWLAAYPTELPNRTDIDPRALNTNSPQRIDSNNGTVRVDQSLGARDHLVASYNHTSQFVKAFQLVAGQNPNTDTRSHSVRMTWTRVWDANTTMDVSAGFDRVGSFLHPEPNSVGPMVSVPGLETLGPLAIIPIRRAQNLYKEAATVRRVRGNHQLVAGFQLLRRQLNGLETDAHRGFYGFSSDFGRTALPANLCPISPGAEALCLGDDFCEPVGEPVEAVARGAVWQGAAEQFQHLLGTGQRIDHAVEAGSKRGHRSLGLGRQMSRP